MGLTTVRLGDKFGYIDEILHNTSSSPITLSSITFPGAGKVLRTLRVEIAQAPPATTGVEGGRYETDPPVMKTRRGCIVETLLPVNGFRLPPDGLVRIWVVFQAIHTGRYKITKHIVYYTQNGVKYRQAPVAGYEGVVTRNGTHLSPSSAEKPCILLTTPLQL